MRAKAAIRHHRPQQLSLFTLTLQKVLHLMPIEIIMIKTFQWSCIMISSTMTHTNAYYYISRSLVYSYGYYCYAQVKIKR